MVDNANKIVFIDGQYQSALSNLGDFSGWLSVDNDGYTFRVPKNFQSKEPVCFKHINKTSELKKLKCKIISEENSDVTIIEMYASDSDHAYENTIELSIHLQSNARLRYCKYQREGLNAQHHAKISAEQERDSFLGTYHVLDGAASSSDLLSYKLMGEGATCESIGFYKSKQQQKFQIDSHIHHLSSSTNSRQLYKGIAYDQSYAAFLGKVMVDPHLKDVCAHQKNDNLLLSREAQIETKPELEIYSEDVRCSHGATVGQLDDEILFYLRSRGVEEGLARELMIDGFANEIFNVIPFYESKHHD